MNIHVDTIEQYKILQHIKKHFFINRITIYLVSPTSLSITDCMGKCLIFEYHNGVILTQDVKNRGILTPLFSLTTYACNLNIRIVYQFYQMPDQQLQ